MTKTTAIPDYFNAITAQEVLEIPADEPERLFTPNDDQLKAEYRFLVKQWHPDINKDSNASVVTDKITKLYEQAKTRLASNTWRTPNEVTFTALNGKKSKLSYKAKYPFELGQAYISRSLVAYVFAADNKVHFDHALSTIRSLNFVNDKMRQQFSPVLPQVEASFAAQDGFVLIVKKEPEAVRLQDALTYCGGTLDPRHAAWILSSLYNLGCYLSINRLTHNDISLQTCFIGPKSHAVSLLGGWWFAATEGEALKNLPDRTFDFAPPDVLRDGRADTRVDLNLIRAVGREMLGDPKGLSLHLMKEVPAALATWLRLPSSGDAIEDYKSWSDKVLTQSFGPRRYVQLNAPFDALYKTTGFTRPPSAVGGKGTATPSV